MKCENCWCRYWNNCKCLKEKEIIIDDKAKCQTFDSETVEVATVFKRQKWLYIEKHGKILELTHENEDKIDI